MEKINEIDIILSIPQLDMFSRSFTQPVGMLSPFRAAKLDSLSGENQSQENEPIPGEFSLLAPSLLDPAASVGLTIFLQDDLIDTSVFYPAVINLEDTVSISQEEGLLRIQQPAPLAEILSLLQQETVSSSQPDGFSPLELKVEAGWLWWALLDLINHPGAERLTIPLLRQHLEESAQELENLAGYASIILDLNAINEAAFMAGINELFQKGILTLGQNGTLEPADRLAELAAQFQAKKTYIAITTNILLENGEFGTIRLYFVQPAGGPFILWYWVDDAVTILNLTSEKAISIITQILADPVSYYQSEP